MDKRFLLAIALSAVVLVAAPLMMPPGQPTPPRADSAIAGATTGATSATVGAGPTTATTAPSPSTPAPAAVSTPIASADTTRPTAAPPVVAETASVTAGRSVYRFV